MAIDREALLQGNRRALAKAITLTESKLDSHRQDAQHLLESLLPHTGNSIRIGITGIPGVGKSTFIEAFGLYLISQGKKVAVLAVDPSSPITGGSILGDKKGRKRGAALGAIAGGARRAGVKNDAYRYAYDRCMGRV